LQVKARSRWIAAPPINGAFLCNIGDMLDRMTDGRYRSTPHRVSSPTERDRLSFLFFFDPIPHPHDHLIRIVRGERHHRGPGDRGLNARIVEVDGIDTRLCLDLGEPAQEMVGVAMHTVGLSLSRSRWASSR